jgi:hypothetical protein
MEFWRAGLMSEFGVEFCLLVSVLCDCIWKVRVEVCVCS